MSQATQSQTQYSPSPSPASGLVSTGGSTQDGQVVCKHGKPARELTVKKPGKNNGKLFYKCTQAQDCDYFAFRDSLQPAKPRGTNASPSRATPTPTRTTNSFPNAPMTPTPSSSNGKRREHTPDEFDDYLDAAIQSSPTNPSRPASPSKRQTDTFEADPIEMDEPELKKQRFTGFAVPPPATPDKGKSTLQQDVFGSASSSKTVVGSPSKSPTKIGVQEGAMGKLSELGQVLGGEVQRLVDELNKELTKQARVAAAANKSADYKANLIKELNNEINVLRVKNKSLEEELAQLKLA